MVLSFDTALRWCGVVVLLKVALSDSLPDGEDNVVITILMVDGINVGDDTVCSHFV